MKKSRKSVNNSLNGGDFRTMCQNSKVTDSVTQINATVTRHVGPRNPRVTEPRDMECAISIIVHLGVPKMLNAQQKP